MNQETRDRRQENGICSKKVMGENCLKNTSQWSNFLMVQIFPLKYGAVALKLSGAVARTRKNGAPSTIDGHRYFKK